MQGGYEERGGPKDPAQVKPGRLGGRGGKPRRRRLQGAYEGRVKNTVFNFGPPGEQMTLAEEDVQQMRITYWGAGGKSGLEQQSGQICKAGLY